MLRKERTWVGTALAVVLVGLLITATPALAQGNGRIDGRLTTPAGRALGGVTVALAGDGVDRATITNGTGNFNFASVPAGDYTLTYTLGDNNATGTVTVTAGATAEVAQQLDWETSFAESITVYSASRRTERITEAPASISVIPQEEIERQATTGQVPKLLEYTPGAEVTQSGLYDFNFNTRGFNSSLNRRILVLIDGRDPSVPFLGSQEWSAVSFPLDDLASVELVRGPGSALYGADAFNGVLNMVTKAPRYSQGGKVQVTGGDLDTRRFDVRAAGALGGDTYFKFTGGHLESEDFAVSRNVGSGGPEYLPCAAGQTTGCLTPEPVPLAVTEDKLTFGGLRFDKYFAGGAAVLTVEGGTASIEGPVAQTGIGRVQLLDVKRPWARANFNTEHWNVLAYYNKRDASDQLALRSGGELVLDSDNTNFEIQGNSLFAGGRGRVVGGASYREENIDSANAQGIQTLMFSPRDESFTGVFGQLEYDLSDSLKAVVALRWDDSTLNDSQFSPRGSLVWAATPDHTFRVTYAEAFQTPNYSEFFLRAPVAPPLNLSAIEQALAPYLGGVPLGFSNVPILALGNPDLKVEEVTSYEAGYTGIFGRSTYVTIDYYHNEINNFITDLIGRIQPALGGNINPAFGPYMPPSALPEAVQQILLQTLQGALGPTFFVMTNAPDGSPILAPVSYVNFGEVKTQGIEASLHHHFTEELSIELNYSWFDFDVQQELAADPVIPNAPENSYNAVLSWVGDKADASLGYRWVDGFPWNAGVFNGPVPSYDVVNVTANYHFNDNWGVGIDVSNALDNRHWEAFGGDILERRALGHVLCSCYAWGCGRPRCAGQGRRPAARVPPRDRSTRKEADMVSAFSLWLPIVLSALAVFVASSIVWMLLPWHKSDYKGVPDQKAVRAALEGIAPGCYNIPHLAERNDLAKPEVKAMFEEGPAGFLFIARRGVPAMGPLMGKWFVFNLVVAFCVAYTTGIGMGPGAPYLEVFRIAATVTWMAYGFAYVADSIWYSRPWHLTWKALFDALIYGLLTGGVFGWLWPA